MFPEDTSLNEKGKQGLDRLPAVYKARMKKMNCLLYLYAVNT